MNDNLPDGTYVWECTECRDSRRSGHSTYTDPGKETKLLACSVCEYSDGTPGRITEHEVVTYMGVPGEHWGANDGKRWFADGFPKPIDEVPA